MTDVEKRVWYALRDRRFEGHKSRRQHRIGPYIVDFACPAKKLVIELDGGQPAVQAGYDARRTAALQQCSWQVIWFWNNDVLANTEGVLTMILAELSEPSPVPR